VESSEFQIRCYFAVSCRDSWQLSLQKNLRFDCCWAEGKNKLERSPTTSSGTTFQALPVCP
jgi:hypothetical protein